MGFLFLEGKKLFLWFWVRTDTFYIDFYGAGMELIYKVSESQEERPFITLNITAALNKYFLLSVWFNTRARKG